MTPLTAFLMYAQLSLAWGIILTGIDGLITFSLDYIEYKTQQS